VVALDPGKPEPADDVLHRHYAPITDINDVDELDWWLAPGLMIDKSRRLLVLGPPEPVPAVGGEGR